jgi:hypothetical protein
MERVERDRDLLEFVGTSTLSGMGRGRGILEFLETGIAGI